MRNNNDSYYCYSPDLCYRYGHLNILITNALIMVIMIVINMMIMVIVMKHTISRVILLMIIIVLMVTREYCDYID